jgi:hypothetical protein
MDDDESTPKAPVVREFPDGSLRQTVDGGLTWTVLQSAPAANLTYTDLGNGIYYGSDGQYYMRGETPQAAPTPDDPYGGTTGRAQYSPIPSTLATRAIGLTGGRAPTPPQMYTDRNGDIVGIDAQTGAEVYRIAGADWPQIDPATKRAIEQGDLAAARRYESAEALAQRQFQAGQTASSQQFQAGQAASSQQFQAGQAASSQQFQAGESALDRAARAQESEYGRQFSAGESALDRALRLGEGEAGRGFTGSQSAIDRAQRASEFAANYGLSTADRARQAQQDRLAAARQLSDVISNVDPAAVAAFSAAGGGVLGNAIGGGQSALSQNALLPAARTLAAAEAPLPTFSPYNWTPPTWTPPPPMAMPAPTSSYTPRAVAPPTTTYGAGGAFTAAPSPAPVPLIAPAPAPAPVPTEPTDYYPDVSGLQSADWTPGPVWEPTPGFATNEELQAPRLAFGTQGAPAAGPFISGDSMHPTDPFAGGARPERVTPFDPPGPNNAVATVEPLAPPAAGGGSAVARLFHAIGDVMDGGGSAPQVPGEPPRYAFGTQQADQALGSLAGPADQPYLDRIRGIREGVDVKPPIEGGYWNAAFGLQPPTVQQRYYAALQSRFGVPSGDFAAEARRFAMPGAGQNAFRLGY